MTLNDYRRRKTDLGNYQRSLGMNQVQIRTHWYITSLLLVALLAGVDLIELIPFLESVVETPSFVILHDSHDMLAVLLIMYTAYRATTFLGWYALALFGAMHIPYVALTLGTRTPEHVRLLVTLIIAFIAIRVISALRQAYQNELTTARILQESLLEVPEHIEGLDVSYFYRSATEATTVGGDFYDAFELEGGKVGVLLGDISGKGLGAATSVPKIRDSIRAYIESGNSPAKVMEQVNDLVCKTLPEGLFATVVFLVVDTSTGAFEYCNAGHPPGFLVKRGGSITALEHNSPLVGAFPGGDFQEEKLIMDDDAFVVLYTDGVSEARNQKEFYGTERIEQLLATLPLDLPVRKIRDAIFEDCSDFAGGHLSDDVAIIVLASSAVEGPSESEIAVPSY